LITAGTAGHEYPKQRLQNSATESAYLEKFCHFKKFPEKFEKKEYEILSYQLD
jgi:hypothetical protein